MKVSTYEGTYMLQACIFAKNKNYFIGIFQSFWKNFRDTCSNDQFWKPACMFRAVLLPGRYNNILPPCLN